MKYRIVNFLLLLFLMITFSGCELIESIFQAGAVAGAIAAIVVIALIFLLARAFRG